MYDKSKEAMTLERRRMFIRLKRFLFKSRCLQYGREDHIKQVERLQNYDFKHPHCMEKWDKSWRDADVSHERIEQSPLYHLSKAIGRVSISPIELSKEYLTNPASRNNLSLLTFDKKELLALQKDIYKNHQKWENIFAKKERRDTGTYKHFWDHYRGSNLDIILHENPKFQDHLYWHSQLNDGTDAGEEWPWYREYYLYKHWMSEIEDKALHTLKMAVAQLLSNFDNATEFNGKGMTKRGQFEDLMSKIEGQEVEAPGLKEKKDKAKKTRKITSSKRDLNYINQILD